MKEIQTQSTSTYSAECDPIVLRQTDRVRLAFLPTLVSNPADPQACVRGQFVYQKKLKGEQWGSAADASLAELKSGEGYKLDLHSAELLKLLRDLADLYRLYRQKGITRGRTTFVKLETGLARFLTLGEAELTSFLESHRDDAGKTLLKLLRWFSSSQSAGDIASQFAQMAPERLPSLAAILGLAAVKDALKHWKENAANSSEEFWQQCLADRTFVLSQIFAHPVVIIKSKAYVGGKQIDNLGGNVVDFLASVESTDAVLLVEIKTPQTPLLGKEYRNDAFPLSLDLNGAIAQLLKYRQTLMREFNSVTTGQSQRFTLGEPHCVVVAGRADRDLTTTAGRESFELQRDRMHGLTIITYDELFMRLERLVQLVEGAASVPEPPPF
jgi:hypothetical protein